MPNVTLHLLLAERVLDAWSCSGAAGAAGAAGELEVTDAPAGIGRGAGVPPGLPESPELRHAFLLGALGPDLGYVPGGHPLLSDLAHCVGSGTLAREVLRQAESPVQRAFALGWVTHVIADRRLHPVVGRGVAHFRGARCAEEVGSHGVHGPCGARGPCNAGFVSADSDPEGHVRVETGIDAWVSKLHPTLRRRRFAPIFDEATIGFLVRAYNAVYGTRFTSGDFLPSHHAMAGMSTRALVAIGLLAARPERPATRLGSATTALADATARRLGRGRLAVAFFTPVPPPPWLRIAVAEEVLGFVPRVRTALEEPEAGLPDVNLDTGRPDGTDPDHRTTRHALQALAALGTGPRTVPVGAAGA